MASTLRFEIRADTPELRAAVNQRMDQLRAEFPDMKFDVRFGVRSGTTSQGTK